MVVIVVVVVAVVVVVVVVVVVAVVFVSLSKETRPQFYTIRPVYCHFTTISYIHIHTNGYKLPRSKTSPK